VYTRTVTESNTQNTSIAFGVFANVNLSGFQLKNIANCEVHKKAGGAVSGFVKMEISKFFAIQPALTVLWKTTELRSKLSGIETEYQFWSIEIPIYYTAQIPMGTGKGLVGAYPYVSLGIDAHSRINGGRTTDLYKKDRDTGNAVMQPWDFGAGVFIGYECRNGLTIKGGWQTGFINALDAERKKATMTNQSFFAGIGWKF
ncbi:MAG: PorT family protein, partial [Prevotellaceae bacterium]|nr:PorT family protein [Prevotellaceae bacterium]